MGLVLLTVFFAGNSFGQYSDDLKDIKAQVPILGYATVGTHKPTPIGDLGHIETVVDLRGFVPLSHTSAELMWTAVRPMRWYKIPTKKALLLLYTGQLSIDHIADDTRGLEERSWGRTRFLVESEARGEAAQWCTLAYDLVEKDAQRIFAQLVGGGFDSAEPTTVFLTQQSAFVLVNFKYDQLNLGDRGQVLLALEFSRSLRRYKTAYCLHSTAIVSKSTSEIVAATAPYIGKVVAAYFGGQ